LQGRRAQLALFALATACVTSAAGRGASAADCRLVGAERRWIRSSLAAWERVSTRALQLPAARPPLLLFYDRRCLFRFPPSNARDGSSPVAVRVGRETFAGSARSHGGTIELPNGTRLRVRPVTYASLLPGDSSTFLLLALEDVWVSDPAYRFDPENWSDYLTRVFVHEMTHARHLTAWAPLLRVEAGRVGLSDLNDDIIQQRFDTVPGFHEAVQRETAMLYEGIAQTGTRRRMLVRAAIDSIQARRARFFGGLKAPWSRIEQLLLDLEGAGQWAALSHLVYSRPGARVDQLIDVVRDSRTYWSQDEGLALYLAVDALVPGWQQLAFSDEPRSSLELLTGALAADPLSLPSTAPPLR